MKKTVRFEIRIACFHAKSLPTFSGVTESQSGSKPSEYEFLLKSGDHGLPSENQDRIKVILLPVSQSSFVLLFGYMVVPYCRFSIHVYIHFAEELSGKNRLSEKIITLLNHSPYIRDRYPESPTLRLAGISLKISVCLFSGSLRAEASTLLMASGGQLYGSLAAEITVIFLNPSSALPPAAHQKI